MKNYGVDRAVSGRLSAWMREQGLTDGALAKMVGAAAPTVQTWRNGTRPSAHWASALSRVTGWDWSDLEAVARGEAVVPATPPDESFANLLTARDNLKRAMAQSQPVDPAHPTDRQLLTLCDLLLTQEVERRVAANPTFADAVRIRELVVAHPNPAELLAFFRRHVDADLLREVEASLRPLVAHG